MWTKEGEGKAFLPHVFNDLVHSALLTMLNPHFVAGKHGLFGHFSYNREQTSRKNIYCILDDLLLAFLLGKCKYYHYQIVSKL